MSRGCVPLAVARWVQKRGTAARHRTAAKAAAPEPRKFCPALRPNATSRRVSCRYKADRACSAKERGQSEVKERGQGKVKKRFLG